MDAYWGGRYAPDEVEELRGEITAVLEAVAPFLVPDPAKCAILPQCLGVAYTDGYCDGMSGETHSLDKYEAAK